MTTEITRDQQLQALTNAAGDYSGTGINHENQNFIGQLSLIPCRSGAFLIEYIAMSPETAEVFHAETSLLAYDQSNTLTLFNSNSNNPMTLAHHCHDVQASEAGMQFSFNFGQPDDKTGFRERIDLAIESNKLTYTYSWGLPGGEFAERSGLTMTKQSE